MFCRWNVNAAPGKEICRHTLTENGQIVEDESVVREDEELSKNSAKPVVVLMWILMSVLCWSHHNKTIWESDVKLQLNLPLTYATSSWVGEVWGQFTVIARGTCSLKVPSLDLCTSDFWIVLLSSWVCLLSSSTLAMSIIHWTTNGNQISLPEFGYLHADVSTSCACCIKPVLIVSTSPESNIDGKYELQV
jgi:hypothetical protein